MNAEELIATWRGNATYIRDNAPRQFHGEAEVWEFCANRLEELSNESRV
jgi:hypothetical protein